MIVPRDYAVVEYLKPRGRLKPREYDAAACYLNKLCFIQHPFCETQESAASLWHQFCYNFIKPYNGLGEVSHDVRGRILIQQCNSKTGISGMS